MSEIPMTPAQLALPYVAFILNRFLSEGRLPLDGRMKARSAFSVGEGGTLRSKPRGPLESTKACGRRSGIPSSY